MALKNLQDRQKKIDEAKDKIAAFTFDDESSEESDGGTGIKKVKNLKNVDWEKMQGQIKEEWG